MAVYYLLTPTECAKLDQAVIFYPYNQGSKDVTSFEARVYKNNELLFTEQVDKTVRAGNYEEVRLQNRVQWEIRDGAYVADRTLDDSWTDPEGMLVSPKIHIDANRKAILRVDYSINGNVKMDLYSGTVNCNSSMKKIASLKADSNTFEYEIEASDEARDFYFGFRSDNPLDENIDYYDGPFYTIELDSLNVLYAEEDAIETILSDKDMTTCKRIENGRVLIIKNGKKYNAAGQRL